MSILPGFAGELAGLLGVDPGSLPTVAAGCWSPVERRGLERSEDLAEQDAEASPLLFLGPPPALVAIEVWGQSVVV